MVFFFFFFLAVPKRRTSKMRRDKRRTHHTIKCPTLTVCTNCGAHILRHFVCQACGFYRDLQFINLTE